MATVETGTIRTTLPPVGPEHSEARAPQSHHRIEEVRKQQGLSLRSVSRQMSVEIRELREQEKPDSDLRLSQLMRWQSVLGVPANELLAEPDAKLSEPIHRRAQLVRVMKTVRALAEVIDDQSTSRLVDTLSTQLTDIMPELENVGAWHSVGQRRSLDEFGRAADRLLSEDLLR